MKFQLEVKMDDDSSMFDVSTALLHAAVLIKNERVYKSIPSVGKCIEVYGMDFIPLHRGCTLTRSE